MFAAAASERRYEAGASTRRYPLRSSSGCAKSTARWSRHSRSYQVRICARWLRSSAGRQGRSCAQWDSQSQRIATSAWTRVPRRSARPSSWEPSSLTSRQIRELVPACGSIAEWNFSAPLREARHWKNITASAPRPTWDRALRAISPGCLATFRPCPVHPGGGMLHEHPRAAPGDRAREVRVEGELDEVPVVGGDQVVVVGDHVDLVGPLPQIDVRAGVRHEVRGHRDVGRELVQDVALGAEALQDLLGAEAAPVQFERGVLHRRGGQRGMDLVGDAEGLSPEGGPPGGVDRLEGAVPPQRPVAERILREGREALAHGRAVLVMDVPERERGMVAVALGQGAGDAGGRGPVRRGRRAGHAP